MAAKNTASKQNSENGHKSKMEKTGQMANNIKRKMEDPKWIIMLPKTCKADKMNNQKSGQTEEKSLKLENFGNTSKQSKYSRMRITLQTKRNMILRNI